MKIRFVIIFLFMGSIGINLDIKGSFAAQKFQLRENPVTLDRAVQPWTNFTVVGRKSFLIGKENGISEVWIPPLKILHDLQFQVVRKGKTYNLQLSKLARHIWVRPEATTIRFGHSAFTIDATYFAPNESMGIGILLDINTSEKMTLLVEFQSDLQPMWPGGLGGQFTYWDDNDKAFIISESLRKYAGIIGSPFGYGGTRTPAHAQPNAPIQFKIAIDPALKDQFIPIVVSGSINGLESARKNYHAILNHLDSLYNQTYLHYKKIRTENLTTNLPDKKLSLALEWAKVALDKGLIDNPQLGRGLVAGFGPSGNSCRPGFAWYFGGDAAINSLAMNDYGAQKTVRHTLNFLIKYQRQDGKIPHEVSQSAAMIPWFKKYPYPYYHAEATPFFLVATQDYLSHTSDTTFVQRNWESIQKAYDYCLSADSNGDGLMDNIDAGIGAVELGSLKEAETQVDIYLASVWTQAAQSMAEMAKVIGDKTLYRECQNHFETARKNLNKKFWNNEKQMLNFALLTNGETIDDLTPWQTVPLCFGLIDSQYANATLEKIKQPEMTTDWGIRFLSKTNPKYQYGGYNTGAVWPFVTTFAIWGGFQYHHFAFAREQWENIAHLTFTQQLGTISELFSGDRFQPMEAAVPHQLFSSAPVILGFTRGILGFEPKACQKTYTFSPHWPRDWNKGQIRNIPIGREKLHLKYKHGQQEIRMEWEKSGTKSVLMKLRYNLLQNEKVTKILVNNTAHSFDIVNEANRRTLRSDIPLTPSGDIIILKGEFVESH